MVPYGEFCASRNAIVKKKNVKGPETLAIPIRMCGSQSVSSSKNVKM